MNNIIHISGKDRKNLCGKESFKYFPEIVLLTNYEKGEYPSLGEICKECKKIFEVNHE